MMFYSDEFASAYAEQRQQQLTGEAEIHRLTRHVRAARPPIGGRMLAVTGSLLVRLGTYLQQRGGATATHLADSQPA